MAMRLAILLFSLGRLPAFTNAAFNFDPYPACARPYLYKDAPASCDYGDTSDDLLKQTDACLCANTTYLTAVSQDIWAGCGCAVLSTTANMIVSVCTAESVTAAYSAEQLVHLGDGSQAVCQDPSSGTAGSTTSTSTSTSTSPAASTGTSSQSTSTSAASTTPSQPTGFTTSTTSQTQSPATTSQPASPSTSSTSPSPQPASTSTQDNSSWLQLQGNRIALGCGIGIGVPMFLLAAWETIRRCRKGSTRPKSRSLNSWEMHSR